MLGRLARMPKAKNLLPFVFLIARGLLPTEKLFAYLDDVYVVTTFFRIICGFMLQSASTVARHKCGMLPAGNLLCVRR